MTHSFQSPRYAAGTNEEVFEAICRAVYGNVHLCMAINSEAQI